jgi:hypothetical protein
MTPYDGCGELAEFPNFGSVQLLRRVQLLGHVRYIATLGIRNNLSVTDSARLHRYVHMRDFYIRKWRYQGGSAEISRISRASAECGYCLQISKI